MKNKVSTVATGRVGNPIVFSLEYLEAEKRMTVFGGQSRDEYEAKIKLMSNCDLSNYASKIGLRPTGERRLLTVNLLKEYDNAVRTLERFGKSFASASPEVREVDDNYDKFIAKFKP